MSKTMKKVSALLLALLMIFSFMPMTQESAYAAAKKPGKVKKLSVKAVYSKDGKSVSLKITWKKAKNAKKYSVSIKDNKTKLTATKTTKKRSLKVKGHFSTSYKVSVKAINGKKKGKAVSKKVTTSADPNKVDKSKYDELVHEAATDKEQLFLLKEEVTKLTTLLTEFRVADFVSQMALEDAKDLVHAYEKIVEDNPYSDLGDDFDELIDKLKEAIKFAEEVSKEANADYDDAKELKAESWNPEVKDAINSMIKANAHEDNKYVVFDFDNTCSIYDVEEQLAVYQLQKMAFAETVDVDELKDILATGIAQDEKDFPQGLDTKIKDKDVLGEGREASYNDFIDDIAAAYQKLLDKGYEPKPEGVEFNKYADDADWKEFATKMRAMYDFVFDAESADVAYPWVLYWFTGMTHEEVYRLAYESHSYYRQQPTEWVTWETERLGSKVGPLSYTWSCGTQVSENINELMAALDNNGIDVWVCSASATDPIRAAIDVWGLHDHVTGLMAMTNVYDGVYDNEYDYYDGCAWYAQIDGWKEGDVATKAQTQGVGKSDAIQNVVGPQYDGHGPIAGFMDSTGDFNFCTEFEDLEVVCCFNRASRKVTDGGGLVAEMAVYEADTLGYDYAKAREAGDTLYVLQGRDETGLRSLCNIPDKDGKNQGRATIRVTSDGVGDPKVFANDDNKAQLAYIIEHEMSVKEAFDKFAMKTAADDPENPLGFKFGFLKKYSGYHSKRGVDTDNAKKLTLDSWNPEVKDAINAMIKKNRNQGKYVVFDFDNTCSIYDVEEQLAIYQLQKMAFAETVDVDELKDILATGIAQDKKDFPQGLDTKIKDKDVLGEGREASYNDFIDDIAAAYQKLLDKGYEPKPEGVEFNKYADDADWKEFATKMRAMYDFVFDAESADVAYPWVLYWFTGMTHEEVYNLAYESHSYYKKQPTEWVTWETERLGSKVGPLSYTWSCGTQVSENINELMAALDNNGIDVWVCSASATDPIRAAIDVWGLHDHVTGLMAMTNKYDGVFDNEYDYEDGCAWYTIADGWFEGDVATEAQTQGVGKSIAIQNVVGPEYDGHGPIAGFMDSTGDFNFCTEFKDLQVVCCFNRASRKVTDGGGLVAEMAVYEADVLGYDYAKARKEGDTLYVLQGRDETGLRSLCNIPDKDGKNQGRATIRVTSDGVGDPKVFANDDNKAQLKYITDEKMSVKEAFDTFAMKTAADDPENPLGFKYGFLKKYSGYHSKDGEIAKLELSSWNKEVKNAINDMMMAEQHNDQYVVFDFDNTCSIYDVEEQLAVYQLQTMAFAETVDVEELKDILATGIAQNKEDFPQGLDTKIKDKDVLGEGREASYNDFIDDIAAAYKNLLDKGYEPTPEGVKFNKYEDDADWLEFATKMRAMYDFVFDAESADVAYPWVLYWFTGMTHDEVYNLAYASHSYYKEQPTEWVTWETERLGSKVGPLKYTWSCGTQVSENIKELMAALDQNGIDVWVCSASATDPIRAAIDVWGLHDYVTGLMAMTNKYDGVFDNEYDYDDGCAWFPTDDWYEDWIEGQTPTEAQTQGKGKVTAIQNVCVPIYDNHGPIAGFMDSTGDFNFCTEFKTLQVVTCFNRASRKVTDGGGLVAEIAKYEADTLGYDYAKAREAGDTLYVLQGRDETDLRTLCNIPDMDGENKGRATIRVTSDGIGNPKVFANADNKTQLDYIIANEMSVKDAFDKFAIKTAAGAPGNPFTFKYGFIAEGKYDGYHSQA